MRYPSRLTILNEYIYIYIYLHIFITVSVYTLRARQMDAISQTIFSNAFSWMKMFEFRLKFHWIFVPKCPINNIPAMVQIMAWRRPSNMPLSEPMVVSLPTHICLARPQRVKQPSYYLLLKYSYHKERPNVAFLRITTKLESHWIRMASICHMFTQRAAVNLV